MAPVSWIEVSDSSNHFGNAVINYNVFGNLDIPRMGDIEIIADGLPIALFSVIQEGLCPQVSFSPQAFSFGADGGPGTVNVTLPTGCRDPAPWSVSDVDPSVYWLSIPQSAIDPHSSSGAFTFRVDPNGTGNPRSASIFIRTDNELGELGVAVVVRQDVTHQPCNYSISRSCLLADGRGDEVTVDVKAPSVCPWNVTRDGNFLSAHGPKTLFGYLESGDATLTIDVDANDNTAFGRYGTVTVGGMKVEVFQLANTPEPDSDCPIRTIAEVQEEASCVNSKALSVKQLSRNYRDRVLAATARGRQYKDLYYRFSSEAVRILLLNPGLMLRARELLERYKPSLQTLVNGQQAALTEGDFDEIDGFLKAFAQRGGPDLKESIEGLRRDLRDPDVQRDLNFTIAPGPRRKLSMQGIAVFERFGAPWGWPAPLGVLIWALDRRRRRIIIKKGRKPFAVALALVGTIVWLAPPETPAATERKAPSAVTPSPLSGLQIALDGHAADDVPRIPGSSNWSWRRSLSFEPAAGPTGQPNRFISRGGAYQFLLAPDEVLATHPRSDALSPELSELAGNRSDRAGDRPGTQPCLGMRLVGAHPNGRMSGVDRLPVRSNYFVGREPASWRSGVPHYSKVRCQDVYPGVDAIYRGQGQQLEYDFILAPGADPAVIRLAFEGAVPRAIDPDGDLVLHSANGDIRQKKPIIYQELNGARRYISGGYTLYPGHIPQTTRTQPEPPRGSRGSRCYQVGFTVGNYDKSMPLIIDPVLSYSTYLGGSGDDEPTAIAVDSAGNCYVAGLTTSTNFPVLKPLQAGPQAGHQDVVVVKLDPAGNLVYSTYLGGSGRNGASSIAVDAAGNAYIAGFAESNDFPTKNAFQAANKGFSNAFVVKLDPAGALMFSTYLGGSINDAATAVAVDDLGDVFVTGATRSSNFPLSHPIQAALAGDSNAFLAMLDPSGGHLVYCTYLGGSGQDLATGVVLDSSRNAYVTGMTASPDFPISNPFQAQHGGGVFDAFVAKIDASGGRLVYSTYLGGSGDEHPIRIAVDSAGFAYITGDTNSPNFPVVGALQPALAGSSDAFVAKLDPSGSHLVYSTFLGGTGIDGGTGIAVGPGGSVYVTGFTNSPDFPIANPMQAKYGGGSFDAFIARLSASGAALEYSTYLGGAGIDAGLGIASDASGNSYVVGLTASTNFPTVSPVQAAYGGGNADIFVAKINPGPIISGAELRGKNLVVTGSGFDDGAKVLINGQPNKTRSDNQSPTATLIAKKGGLQIDPGQGVVIRVQNSSGALSNEFDFKRPAG
jgi:hypothetical protein